MQHVSTLSLFILCTNSLTSCPLYVIVIGSLMWLVIIFILNLFGARGYGEAEYWFSMIKVLTIIIFIIVGAFISGGVIG